MHTAVVDDIGPVLAELAAKTKFFVCASMKSGTTWLQIMLDAHPAISCKGEGHLVEGLGRAFQTAANSYNQHIDWKNGQRIGGLDGYPFLDAIDLVYTIRTAALLLFLHQIAGKRVQAIGEKTPDNILGMEFLDMVFPEAKFVVLVRDGRDCAVSGWFHNRRLSPDWMAKNYPTLDSYAALTAAGWAKEQAAAVRFAEAKPGRCLFLRYEDMIAAPEPALARVLDFIGVESGAEIVEEICRKSEFAALAEGRRRGDEDTASFFRKGVAGDWRNHFSAEATAQFERDAGLWLAHFGYLEAGR